MPCERRMCLPSIRFYFAVLRKMDEIVGCEKSFSFLVFVLCRACAYCVYESNWIRRRIEICSWSSFQFAHFSLFAGFAEWRLFTFKLLPKDFHMLRSFFALSFSSTWAISIRFFSFSRFRFTQFSMCASKMAKKEHRTKKLKEKKTHTKHTKCEKECFGKLLWAITM